jgi:5'-3' exonuclease
MGVPYFGSWLRSDKYSHVFKTIVPNNVSGLYLDMNGLIHLACGICYMYGDFEDAEGLAQLIAYSSNPEILENDMFRILFELIYQIVIYTNPKDTIYLAVDGVVPKSKREQSRSRRFRNGKNITATTIFDSTSISPGTRMMHRLHSFFEMRLNDKGENSMYNLFGARRIFYDCHLIAGEGEHKIFDFFRQGLAVVPENPDGYHIIYGMDADLIILSLLSNVENIVLAKDSVPLVVKNSIGKRVNGQKNPFRSDNRNVFVKDLRQALLTEMGRPSSVQDFCLFVSLVGNDFLPHPAIGSNLGDLIDSLMGIYHEVTGSLVETSLADIEEPGTGGFSYRINWYHVLELLSILGNDEARLLNKVAASDLKNPFKAMEGAKYDDGTINYDIFRENWYRRSLCSLAATGNQESPFTLEARGAANALGYLGYLSTEPTLDSVNEMCRNYLTGLNWVLQYYTRGSNAVTWRWWFPYYHAPMIFDVAMYLINNTEFASSVGASILPIKGERRFTYAQQLVATVPPQSINLVPDQLKFLYGPLSPIMDLMPTSFDVEKDGTTVDWANVVLLPFSDDDRIFAAVPADLRVETANLIVVAIPTEKFVYTRDRRSNIVRPEREYRAREKKPNNSLPGFDSRRTDSNRLQGFGEEPTSTSYRGKTEQGRGRGLSTAKGRGDRNDRTERSKGEWRGLSAARGRGSQHTTTERRGWSNTLL